MAVELPDIPWLDDDCNDAHYDMELTWMQMHSQPDVFDDEIVTSNNSLIIMMTCHFKQVILVYCRYTFKKITNSTVHFPVLISHSFQACTE